MKQPVAFSLVAAMFLVLGALGASLVSPSASRAQSRAREDVAVTAGPGGVWVVRGDKLYTCTPPVIQRPQTPNQPPPTPVCSVPLDLP